RRRRRARPRDRRSEEPARRSPPEGAGERLGDRLPGQGPARRVSRPARHAGAPPRDARKAAREAGAMVKRRRTLERSTVEAAQAALAKVTAPRDVLEAVGRLVVLGAEERIGGVETTIDLGIGDVDESA